MSETWMPGAIESSKHYESMASFHEDEHLMTAKGWTAQTIRIINVEDSFVQRTFHRHAPEQVDVRYLRPDWPDT